MHIKFTKISYKNLLSVGNSPVEIAFDKNSTTLLYGQNGQGKSTIIEALHFCLYGKPFRKIVKNQLINNVNNKDLLVKVWFEIGNKKYRIERGIKPAIFDIYVNGKKLNNDSNNVDFQRELEYTILKTSKETFRQIVVLGSTSYVPFMRLKSRDRNLIIEDLLDIQVFSKMLEVLRGKLTDVRRQQTEISHSIDLVNASLKSTHSHIDEINRNNDQIKNRNANEVKELRKSIDVIRGKRDQVLEVLEKINFDNEVLKEKKAARDKVMQSSQSIESQILSSKRDAKFFEANDVCPSCSQAISENVRAEKKEELERKIELFGRRLDKSQKIFKKAEDNISEYLERKDAIVDLTRSEKNLKQKINNLLSNIERLEDTGIMDISNSIERIKDLTEQLTEHQEKQNEIINLTQEYHFIQELLNENGIKSSIIKTYLPIINKIIANYLSILEFDAAFTFDETFNEEIKIKGRDTVQYFGLSEGQKMRIDLCLLFAFRDVSRLKNSTSSNLLIFDEIGDSSLDNEGFEAFLRILEDAAAQGSNIFVISHNQDLQSQDKLDRAIKFQKVAGFTEIEEQH